MLATLGTLTGRMEELLTELREPPDARRFFHSTYLRTTRAIAAELDAGGFEDGQWVERWAVAFAELYLSALEEGLAGLPVPAPWAAAFGADPALPPMRHVLLGINAHINYDLPHALLDVITDAEFADPAYLLRREAEHRHIDEVLSTVVDGSSGLRRVNRFAVKRFLAEARAKVWRNARVLAAARQRGPGTYLERSAELEYLSAERVTPLTGTGPVLTRLAVAGFGVTMRPLA